MKNFVEDQIVLSKLKKKDVYGYGIFRSPTQTKFVNIVAVNSEYEPLFVRYADLTLDEAETFMGILSKENRKE